MFSVLVSYFVPFALHTGRRKAPKGNDHDNGWIGKKITFNNDDETYDSCSYKSIKEQDDDFNTSDSVKRLLKIISKLVKSRSNGTVSTTKNSKLRLKTLARHVANRAIKKNIYCNNSDSELKSIQRNIRRIVSADIYI